MAQSLLLAAVLLLLAAAGSSAGPSGALEAPVAAAGGPHEISVGEVNGTPSYSDGTTGAAVTVVTAGTTVRWSWDGELGHSVTSGIGDATGPDGTFDSGIRNPGSEFSRTFDETGVFKYYCMVHPVPQHGVIVVV